MRIFIAIDITEEIRARLGELIETLRSTARGLRWADPGGMHLTLKFIGEISEEKLKPVEEALGSVRVGEPIQLTFRNLGFFPGDRHPRVFWVGVEAPPSLAQLVAQIDRALSPLGIAPEQRAFSPHLTLGRFRSEDGLERLREAIARHRTAEFGRLEAKEFCVFQSILGPHGARYVKRKQINFESSG